MEQEIAVEFCNVTKEYKLGKKSQKSIRQLLFSKNNIKNTVLDNISFTIHKGESVAILGKNGMGKSTILKLLSGVSYPTLGTINVNGNVNSILELNAGLDLSFTGRKNIYFKCRVLGLSKLEINSIVNDIIDFSGIGRYIDEPVQTYSSGMRARLGFAIIAFLKTDILAIDEVLSVGDYEFQNKCKKKILEFTQSKNHTFILVTHNCDTAKEFCNRGLLLNDGHIVYDGNINSSVNKFLKLKSSR